MKCNTGDNIYFSSKLTVVNDVTDWDPDRNGQNVLEKNRRTNVAEQPEEPSLQKQ